MDHSPSGSSCTGTEDSSSVPNLSPSVSYFPREDTSSEHTLPCEGASPVGPSVLSAPPIQGRQHTERLGRLLGRRGQIQDDPEQLCKWSIPLAWDADVDSCSSDWRANWDLSGDKQWADKNPEEKTQPTLSKLDGLVQKPEELLENHKDDDDDDSVFPEPAPEEDFRLAATSPLDTAQVSHHKHDSRQDLPEFNPANSEDVLWFSQIPQGFRSMNLLRWKARHLVTKDKHYRDALSLHRSAGGTHSLNCLNFRWVFRQLRQQVLSSLLGRGHPEMTTESTHQRHKGKDSQRRESDLKTPFK